MAKIKLYDEEIEKAVRKYINEEYNIWWADQIPSKQIEINHFGDNKDSTPYIEIDTSEPKKKVKK